MPRTLAIRTDRLLMKGAVSLEATSVTPTIGARRPSKVVGHPPSEVIIRVRARVRECVSVCASARSDRVGSRSEQIVGGRYLYSVDHAAFPTRKASFIKSVKILQ